MFRGDFASASGAPATQERSLRNAHPRAAALARKEKIQSGFMESSQAAPWESGKSSAGKGRRLFDVGEEFGADLGVAAEGSGEVSGGHLAALAGPAALLAHMPPLKDERHT